MANEMRVFVASTLETLMSVDGSDSDSEWQ